MSQLALDLGVPSTLVTTAVYARGLSSVKDAQFAQNKFLRARQLRTILSSRPQFHR
ncbi:MAG: hypothetical protein U0930_14705 [Pirellulales bacterium]